jgi:hypothetical protein
MPTGCSVISYAPSFLPRLLPVGLLPARFCTKDTCASALLPHRRDISEGDIRLYALRGGTHIRRITHVLVIDIVVRHGRTTDSLRILLERRSRGIVLDLVGAGHERVRVVRVDGHDYDEEDEDESEGEVRVEVVS